MKLNEQRLGNRVLEKGGAMHACARCRKDGEIKWICSAILDHNR